MKDSNYPKIELRPYCTKELAGLYKVSRKTFLKWINKFKTELGEKSGRYYNVKQVRCIFDNLGLPTWDNK